MTPVRARLAGALAVPLLMAGCGTVSSAASSLEADVTAANAALSSAKGIGVVVRFSDPDGDLERALHEWPGGIPAELAEVVAGSGLGLRAAATEGRTLADQPDPALPLAEQLRWVDTALTVSTEGGELLSWRTVDGVLYVSSDLVEVERVVAAAGAPLSLRDELAGAPASVAEVEAALRAGEAVRVPVADLLAEVGDLPDGEGLAPGGLPEGLAEDLRAAVEPHARLTDLGSDDGVRRVTVEVEVKQLLGALGRALGSSEAGERRTAALRDGSVTGTITIDDGHYRRLELPLADLAGLAVVTDVDLPDLGDSALVVELDDTLDSIPPPSRVADLDLLELLGDAHGQRRLSDGPSFLPESSRLGAEQTHEELMACFEQAETEAQFEACGEPTEPRA